VAYHEVRTQQNTPLIDIIDENTASDYFRAIYRVLLQHKRNGDTLHLLIAGGRKSMSVYAALAAALIFRQHDCLWHVVSASRDIEVPGQFHIPPESRADVYLVAMPLVPTRAVVWDMPPEYIDDPMKRVADAQDVRNGFLRLLTNAERELALFVEEHPDRDAERIGQELTISPSTVNNHLGNIYNKLSGYLELPRDESPRKHTPKMKQMLLRLLGGKL
jgi:DNA-binding CsgD family transcriptional regulator